jgi:hypothetical protein
LDLDIDRGDVFAQGVDLNQTRIDRTLEARMDIVSEWYSMDGMAEKESLTVRIARSNRPHPGRRA